MEGRNDWVCSTHFYALYIADPRTLLSQMKKKGIVESRWCKVHDHKMKEWRLTTSEPQLTYLGTNKTYA